MNSTVKRADRALAKHLPLPVYLWLSRFVRGLRNRQRRGGPTPTVERFGRVLRITWSDGKRFFFAEPYRYQRYLWREGRDHVFARLRARYSSPSVHVSDGDVVIDIGANVGEFSCSVAADALVVHAIEPDRLPFEALRNNAAMYGNIVPHPIAFGEADAQVRFFLATDEADSSVIEPESFTEAVEVPARTLATFMREQGLAEVNFLKVEAEGYEPEILRGAGEALLRVEKVALEGGAERRGETTIDECEVILKGHGFETTRSHPMLFARNPKFPPAAGPAPGV